MIAFRHSVVRIDIKLLTVVLRCFQQGVQICSGVGLGREAQSHRWPTIFVVDGVEGLFVQIVVDVNPLRVAGVCHAMVTDEDDVDDICEVATLQGIVEIFGEDINSLQCILLCSSESGHSNGNNPDIR